VYGVNVDNAHVTLFLFLGCGLRPVDHHQAYPNHSISDLKQSTPELVAAAAGESERRHKHDHR
jgi:hypothetical protein